MRFLEQEKTMARMWIISRESWGFGGFGGFDWESDIVLGMAVGRSGEPEIGQDLARETLRGV